MKRWTSRRLRQRGHLLATALVLIPTALTVWADGPMPPGPSSEGIPQTWPSQPVAPIVDLPVTYNDPMALPATLSTATQAVAGGSDALSQIDLCSGAIVCVNSTNVPNPTVPAVQVTTALPRTTYSAGEAVGLQVQVSNPSTGKLVVASAANAISTGFLPMPAGAITMDGAPCNANTSPACTVTAQGLQISSFTLANKQAHTFAFAMVTDWGVRGCGDIADQATATTSGGTSTGAVTVTSCDAGLGVAPWWSYVQRGTGPQAVAQMNVANGNLVLTQDDSTAVPGHGRLVLQPRRAYNSEDSGVAPAPNAFGTGWGIDFERFSGATTGMLGVAALFVPPAESVAANHAVTVIDDSGMRLPVALRPLGTPVDVTALATSGAITPLSTLVPRVLQLDTSHYDHICVDQDSAPAAGVHLGIWRYIEVSSASSSTPCASATGTTPVVLGFGAERPDRVRYEFAWNGAKLDAEDGNANEVRYLYAAQPSAGTALGALSQVVEQGSGRSFTLTHVSSAETDVIDPSGRTTRYLFDGANHLTSVVNPDGSSVAYAYGGCAGALVAQLCSTSDPRQHSTGLTYTGTWSDGTTVDGPPKLASISDRSGAVTSVTHVHVPDSVTADLGVERTRFSGFDSAGSVGEVDGIDMTNSSSPVTLHQTLDFWDTASGAGTCTQPDAAVDHDMCRQFRESGSTQAKAEDTSFVYDMAGQTLVQRQCLASADSTSPPACPASTSALVTSRDTTWGYHAQYVEASGTAATYDDTPAGGGTVSSTSVLGGTRWDAQTLFAIYDNTAMLGGVGNTPGLSSAQVQSYVRSITVDDSSAVAPDRQVAAGTCPTVAANTGNVCATSGPGGTSSNVYQYTYDAHGQRASMATPAVLAASASPFQYTYYADSDLDLSATTSAGGWLKAVTDPYGHFTAYAYDAAGNRVRTWDADATSGMALSSFPGGATTPPSTAYQETSYGAFNNPWRYVVSQRDQLGDTTGYTNDADGNALTIRPPRGTQANSAADDITQQFDARDERTSRQMPVEKATGGGAWSYAYDAAGNLTVTTDPMGVVTVNVYDAVNRLVTVKYTMAPITSGGEATPSACTASAASDAPIPANHILCTRSRSYDMVDNVVASSDGNHQVTTVTFDGLHRETSRSVPRNDGTYGNLRTDHVYDLDDNVVSICPPRAFTDGGASSCTASAAQPYRVDQSFDALDRLASRTTYEGSTAQPYAYSYDADGNLAQVQDPNTHLQSAAFDLLDRRVSDTRQRSATTSVQTSYAYDPASRLLSTITGVHRTAYAYDAAGRRTDEVDGWDGSSAVATAVASSDGGTNVHTRVVYDADGNTVQVYDPRAFAGSSLDQRTFMLTAVFDADDRQVAQDVPRYDGGSYSDLSFTSSVQSSECHTSTAGYPSTVGVCATSMAYDGDNRVTDVTWPTTTSTTPYRKTHYVLGDDGLPTEVNMPSPAGGTGLVMNDQYWYDAEQHVVKHLDALSRPVTFAYTSDYLRKQMVAEPNGSITHVTNDSYNPDGDLARETDPATLATSYTYYSDDREQTVADNAGETTKYVYDRAGNPSQVYSPAAFAKVAPDTSGTPTTDVYTYDNLLLTSTVPVSSDGTSQLRRTTYGYADVGAKTSQDVALVNSSGSVLSDAGTQSFAYYPDMRLQQETGRQGETIQHRYDAAGNQTSVVEGGSTVSATYYLDDLLRSAQDTASVSGAGSATTSYGYDGLGNVTSREESVSSGGQYVTDYSYNDAEMAGAMSAGWIGTWSWTYDQAGQLTQEADPNGDKVLQSWNADGTLDTRTLTVPPNGNFLVFWEYTYDSDYRQLQRTFHGVTANNAAVTQYQDYGYNNAGRLSSFTPTDLTGAPTLPARTISWDVDGNRLSYSDGTTAGTTSSTYNADDSPATSTANGVTRTLVHDAAGNLTNDGCSASSYDGFGRLTRVAGTGASNCGRIETDSYSYDGLDRQTVVADGPLAGATAVHFDGLSQSVVMEQQQQVARPADVVYAMTPKGAVVADTFAPQSFNHSEFLSQDGFSSITHVTNSAGAVSCDAFSDPFGIPMFPSGSNPCHTGGMNDTLLYRQAQRDPTSGSYNLGRRSYEPSKAAFDQPDSYRIEGSDLALQTDPQTRNPYGYAGGDPVNNSDPTGHVECTLGPDCQEMQATSTGDGTAGSIASQLAAGRAPGYTGGASEQAYGSTTHTSVPLARMPDPHAPPRTTGLAHLQDMEATHDAPYNPTTWSGDLLTVCADKRGGFGPDQQCTNVDVPAGTQWPSTDSLCASAAQGNPYYEWTGFFRHCYVTHDLAYDTATPVPGGGTIYHHTGGFLENDADIACVTTCRDLDAFQCYCGTVFAGPLSLGEAVLESSAEAAGEGVVEAGPLAGTTYSPKVIGQMQAGDAHAFPASVDRLASWTDAASVQGNDGTWYLHINLPGSVNGQKGFFQYIVDQNGVINHRMWSAQTSIDQFVRRLQ